AGPRRWTHHLPVLLFLNLSFPAEAFVSRELGFLIRAAVLCFVLVKHFRVFSSRSAKGFLGSGLRVAAFALVLPHLLLPFFATWELHLLHAAYIGGFALITVMVAVRVVLSHGGKSLEFELKNRSLAGIAALLLTAGFLRSAWPMWKPGDVFSIAAVASGFWLAALTVRWLNVGRKIDRISETIHG
ncbi:MAG TPA: NnrS family protein, partial [Pseudobdellovibrionaceae bacterium]|nr:NnrS family protein [Pseudobdellovibrionaceae bacterium]